MGKGRTEAVRAAERARYARRAYRDPEGFARMMACKASYSVAYDAERARQRKRERSRRREERRQLVVAAVAWLRTRGLRLYEIAALIGVKAQTVGDWVAGRRLPKPAPAESVTCLLRVAGDMPAWGDRKKGEGHPWLPVLAARMEQEAA